MILVQIVLRKFREIMTCSKLYVTKIKYSKSLRSQKTEGEIKPVIILL